MFPADVDVVPQVGSVGAAAEFVSLNVKAVDAAGNSVERTTMRAHDINRPLG